MEFPFQYLGSETLAKRLGPQGEGVDNRIALRSGVEIDLAKFPGINEEEFSRSRYRKDNPGMARRETAGWSKKKLAAHPQMDDHGLSGIQLKEEILGSSLQGYDPASGDFPDKASPGRIAPQHSAPFRIGRDNYSADYLPPEAR